MKHKFKIDLTMIGFLQNCTVADLLPATVQFTEYDDTEIEFSVSSFGVRVDGFLAINSGFCRIQTYNTNSDHAISIIQRLVYAVDLRVYKKMKEF